MRSDLISYVPEAEASRLLMCPACGRFLPAHDFSLEHIIPQQAVAEDPAIVREEISRNTRSGLTLLCRRPLSIKGSKGGCNSWKGTHFDNALRQVVSGSLTRKQDDRGRDRHCIAVMSAAYLAMFAKFGYKIVLMDSGVLLRQQFFLPDHCHTLMPDESRVLFSDQPPAYSAGADFWRTPFRFDFEKNWNPHGPWVPDTTAWPGYTRAEVRNTTAFVPTSLDPRLPLAQTALIVPSKYKMRPNFETAFNPVKVDMSKRKGTFYMLYAPAVGPTFGPPSQRRDRSRSSANFSFPHYHPPRFCAAARRDFP